MQIRKVTTSKIKKVFKKPGAVGIKDNKYLPKAIANVKNASKDKTFFATYLLKIPTKQSSPTSTLIPPYTPATSE